MDPKIREAIFNQVGKEPFAKKFGLELVGLDEGYSRVEMDFTPDLENLFGMAHGGALFALIDEAFETASNSHGTMAVALNMNITYIAPLPGAKDCVRRPGRSIEPTGPLFTTSKCSIIRTVSSRPARPLSIEPGNRSPSSRRKIVRRSLDEKEERQGRNHRVRIFSFLPF